MPHVLSAVQYRFANAWATLDELLLIRSVSIDAVLIAFLYGMVRTFGVRPWAAAGGVAFVVLASSFEGLWALYDFSRNNAPLAAVKNLNIDAVTRWYFQGIPIDGLQRLLFYQPHHVVGYGIGMIGLITIARRIRPVDATAFAIAGLCLGLSVAISSFAGLMLTAGGRNLRRRGGAASVRLAARFRARRRRGGSAGGGHRRRPGASLRRQQRVGGRARREPHGAPRFLVGHASQLWAGDDSVRGRGAVPVETAARPRHLRGARRVVRDLLFLHQRPRSPGRVCGLARGPLPVHGGHGGDRRVVRAAAQVGAGVPLLRLDRRGRRS